MSHTYAAIYKAFRNGASKTHTVAYQSDKPIDSGELLSALIDGIARNAVSSGQANSVNDVSLIGVSLLTPPPQQVTAAVETADKDELVTAVAELYEALEVVRSRNYMTEDDQLSLIDTLEFFKVIYDKCKI